MSSGIDPGAGTGTQPLTQFVEHSRIYFLNLARADYILSFDRIRIENVILFFGLFLFFLTIPKMKTIFTVFVLCCLSCLITEAQEKVWLQSGFNETYLNVETGKLKSTKIEPGWWSAQWDLELVGEGQYRIKNVWTNKYLNIESGKLECTEVEDGWLSARWAIEYIPDLEVFRFSNVWKPDLYINIEDGKPVCSTIEQDLVVSYWLLGDYWPLEGERPFVGENPFGDQWTSEEENQDPIEDPSEVTAPEITIQSDGLLNIQEILAAHNTFREEVGVPPLTWSTELASQAQAWADEVASKNTGQEWFLQHSQSPNVGENIAGGILSGDSPADRVRKSWGEKEKANFNSQTRKCKSGTQCGHYTQIIWRSTTQVGCGVAKTPNGRYILVCNYNPPGNFIGEPAY